MPDEFETVALVSNICSSLMEGAALAFPLQCVLLSSLGLLGGVLSSIMGLANPEDDRLFNELTKIGYQLTDISRKMDSSVATLGNLIVDHSFTKDVTIKVDTLDRMMHDVFRARSNFSRDNFFHECRKNTPYSLVMEIKGRLKYDSTNPLIKAMEADELKTKKTFDAWENTIKSLLSRLSLLHYFYIGLSSLNAADTNHSYVLMNETINDVRYDLDNFINNYDSNYWPSAVQKLVENTVDSNEDLSYDEKAKIFETKLSQIRTTDLFYIMVYRPWHGYVYHAFSGDYVSVLRRGGCNVVIARSRNALKASQNDMTIFKNKVESYRSSRTPRVTSHRHPNGYQTSRDMIRKDIDAAGFVAIIAFDNDNEVAIRSTGSRQPGWWVHPRAKYWPWGQEAGVKIVVGYA